MYARRNEPFYRSKSIIYFASTNKTIFIEKRKRILHHIRIVFKENYS